MTRRSSPAAVLQHPPAEEQKGRARISTEIQAPAPDLTSLNQSRYMLYTAVLPVLLLATAVECGGRSSPRCAAQMAGK